MLMNLIISFLVNQKNEIRFGMGAVKGVRC